MNDVVSTLGAHLLDEGHPTPLYHQIYALLREHIRRGEIIAGAVLPGEQELARLFSVSRITAKRAMNELAEDGLVTRHRGRGTMVSGGMRLPVVKASFETLIESLTVMGYETATRLIEHDDVAVGEEAADLLELPAGTVVRRIVRVRSLEGEPMSHLTSYVPLAVAERFRREDLATQSMLKIYDDAGVTVVDAEQWISAGGASPSVASALGLTVGAPVLRIMRLMRERRRRPVQLIYAYYHPDRFEYHLRTHRAKGSWRQGE